MKKAGKAYLQSRPKTRLKKPSGHYFLIFSVERIDL